MELSSHPHDIDGLTKVYDYWDRWLKSQRMSEFVEVNLGSWSGLNARQMAEDAGFLDLYNYVYQPFSAAVHSNWAHLSDKNTVPCENPSHRTHRSPAILDMGIDPYWLYLAAKYLQKTFSHFDKTIGIHPPPVTAYDSLYDALYGAD